MHEGTNVSTSLARGRANALLGSLVLAARAHRPHVPPTNRRDPLLDTTARAAARVQVENRPIMECAKTCDECAGLRTSYFVCKRGQIDPRTRIKGNKGF